MIQLNPTTTVTSILDASQRALERPVLVSLETPTLSRFRTRTGPSRTRHLGSRRRRRERLDAETDFPIRANLFYFHLHLLADLINFILHGIDPLGVRVFADVQKPVLLVWQSQEPSKRRLLDHLGRHHVALFRHPTDHLNPLKRRVQPSLVARKDTQRALVILFDIAFFMNAHLRTGASLQLADVIALGPDQTTNQAAVHANRRELRAVLGDGFAAPGLGNGTIHLVDHRAPRDGRDIHSLDQDIQWDSRGLAVELDPRDSAARSRNLKVHIAEYILQAHDIRQQLITRHLPTRFVLVHDETYGYGTDVFLDGHAGVHQRQRSGANSRHGGAPIALHRLRVDANREGPISRRWDDAGEGLFSERAVTNLAS